MIEDTIQSYYHERILNARNPYQGARKRVLCICSAGLLRSPTLAWILSNSPWGYNTRAAGSRPEYALIPVDEALLQWSDLLIFVNQANATDTGERFELSKLDYKVLDIPDNFGFRDRELIRIMMEQLTQLELEPFSE